VPKLAILFPPELPHASADNMTIPSGNNMPVDGRGPCIAWDVTVKRLAIPHSHGTEMTRVRNRHRDRQRPVRQRLGASDMATNIRAECLLSAETGGNWAAGAPRNDGAGSVDDYPPKTSPDEDTQDDATMVEPGSSQTGLRWISGRYSGQDTFANRTTAIGQTAINRLDKMQRQSARLHEQWLMPLDFPWFREKSGPMLPAAVDGRIGAIDPKESLRVSVIFDAQSH